MGEAAPELRWGIVLCKRCNEVVDMFETKRPTVYYGECKIGPCAEEPREEVEE